MAEVVFSPSGPSQGFSLALKNRTLHALASQGEEVQAG